MVWLASGVEVKVACDRTGNKAKQEFRTLCVVKSISAQSAWSAKLLFRFVINPSGRNETAGGFA